MPIYFLRRPTALRLLLGLTGLLLGGCARRDFFQADARVGAGSNAALPPTADSVLATAGRHYNRHSGVYEALLGRHYRRVWAAPVRAPVLRLATAVPGGLRPGKLGGGYQSISMTLVGAQGREYSLRTLDKEPSKILPAWLRPTFLVNAVRDATSAALPYAALTVPPLARAAGVPHGRPRLVYVRPDETGLGPVSARFQGKLALLEEKYNAPASRTPDLAGTTDFLGSEAVLKRVYADPTHAIDQAAFLRARLLDVWLGDWDRHEGQWQWAAHPEGRGRVGYRPIPKDRDQVFFRFDDGALPWLVSRRGLVPRFQTFRGRYGNVAGLVHQAKFIDERGLAQMTRADFQRAAADLQRHLPDSLIERAMRQLPPAVFALEGPGLATALCARRDALPQAADQFYRTLARRPTVGGTARPEHFTVRQYADSVTVLVQVEPSTGTLAAFYARTFYPAETRHITLEGLGGDDVFAVVASPDGRPPAPIRLRLRGGSGTNRLEAPGPPRRFRYDDGRTTPPRPYNRLNDD